MKGALKHRGGESDQISMRGFCAGTFCHAAATALWRPKGRRARKPSQVLYICLQTKTKAPHNDRDASGSLGGNGPSSSSSLRVNWTMTWAATVLQRERERDVHSE